MNENIRRILDKAFPEFCPPPAKPCTPATTDRPQIKLFMLQMMNEFASNVGDNTLRWGKAFKHKASGKQFRIEITVREDIDHPHPESDA